MFDGAAEIIDEALPATEGLVETETKLRVCHIWPSSCVVYRRQRGAVNQHEAEVQLTQGSVVPIAFFVASNLSTTTKHSDEPMDLPDPPQQPDWGETESDESDDETLNTLDCMGRYVTNLKLMRLKTHAKHRKALDKLDTEKQVLHEDLRRETTQLQYKLSKAEREVKGLKSLLHTQQKKNKELALSNQNQAKRVADAEAALQQYMCDLCYTTPKTRITRCGHGYCTRCLPTHMNWAQYRDVQRGEAVLADECLCAFCRQKLRLPRDVWDLHITG